MLDLPDDKAVGIFLTSYGKLISSSLDMMNKASAHFEKLVAIDSMESSNIANNMPEEEGRKIVEILISNRQIKEILLLQRRNLRSSLHDDKNPITTYPPAHIIIDTISVI